jgi:hypothetical protein
MVILATPLLGGIMSGVGAWVGLTGKRLLPVGKTEVRIRALQERVLGRMTRSRAD